MDDMLSKNATLPHTVLRDPSRFFTRSSEGSFGWLDRSQDSAWDQFVECHPLGTVCQTTRWRNVIETSFPHISGRALVIRDRGGAIQCGTMAYTVRSWFLGGRLVSVPFASRVDPLVSNAEQLARLTAFLADECVRSEARSLQIRLSEAPLPSAMDGQTVISILKRHYLRLTEGTDTLWSQLAAELRRTIRSAGRHGVRVRRGTSNGDWELFYTLHGGTRQRVRMPVLPQRFFAALQRCLRHDELELLIAERDGEPLAVGLLLIFNGVEQGEWLGDTLLGRRFNANQKLHWETIERAAARGCHTFCFGRTDADHQGLLEYKRRWGCVEQDMPLIMAGAAPGSVQRRADNGLVRHAAQRLIASAPWPLFLEFSERCYRHLG